MGTVAKGSKNDQADSAPPGGPIIFHSDGHECSGCAKGFSGQEHHLWIYKLVPFDTDCQSTQWCDIVTQCCFPKTPTGGPCFGPGIGTSCANGACLERFPFGKIFLWPPSALTYMLGVCA